MTRTEPLFSFVEFQHLDSAREACAVCSLDMNGDAGRWEDAVAAAVRETRRMGAFGLTQSELERFGAALVTDSEQLAAMGDQLAHGEQLTHLMETAFCRAGVPRRRVRGDAAAATWIFRGGGVAAMPRASA